MAAKLLFIAAFAVTALAASVLEERQSCGAVWYGEALVNSSTSLADMLVSGPNVAAMAGLA